MKVIAPLEIRHNVQLHPKDRSRDGLHASLYLEMGDEANERLHASSYADAPHQMTNFVWVGVTQSIHAQTLFFQSKG